MALQTQPVNTSIPLDRLTSAEVLSRVVPFAGAPESELTALAAAASRIRRPARTVLLDEGERPDGFYVVLRGRVNLARQADPNRDLILAVLGPSDGFGERCVFDDSVASTRAVAATTAELLRIPADAVAAHIRRYPNTAVGLMKLLSRKLQDMETVASGLALCDVESRLKQTLTRLAQRQGRRSSEEHGWIVAPMPTQSELARMVGSCRETVSRTLGAMARNGLLTASGRRMILHDSMFAEAAA